MDKKGRIVILIVTIILIGIVIADIVYEAILKIQLDSLNDHIADIEHSLSLKDEFADGTYTYEELLIESKIKCESYKISNRVVVFAENCLVGNKKYNYGEDKEINNAENKPVDKPNDSKPQTDTNKDNTQSNTQNNTQTNNTPKNTQTNTKEEDKTIKASTDKELRQIIGNYSATRSYNDIVNLEIPDKYNTGVQTKTRPYVENEDLAGIPYLMDKRDADNPTILVRAADLKKLSGNYVIENIDFTNYRFRMYAADVDTKVTITFRNCKFSVISLPYNLDDDVRLVFEYSNINRFVGANSTFNKCYFKGNGGDTMNPYKNVHVKNSYISDLMYFTSSGEIHYDGVQIYGTNSNYDFEVYDISFYNTRFEVPCVSEKKNGVKSTSYVNAPINNTLEFNNARNITYEKIYVNGGGYSIYTGARAKAYMGYEINYKNVVFKDIYVGRSHLYGILYPMKEKDIKNTTFSNVGHYDLLLVSSTWKDSKGVHVITSNDTLVERKLRCVTDKGNYDFTVPAHPKLGKGAGYDYKFSDLPYDIDYTIPNKNITSLSCYDVTDTTELSNNNLLKVKKF